MNRHVLAAARTVAAVCAVAVLVVVRDPYVVGVTAAVLLAVAVNAVRTLARRAEASTVGWATNRGGYTPSGPTATDMPPPPPGLSAVPGERLDLDAICARYDAAWPEYPIDHLDEVERWRRSCEDVPALIVEVERLRAQLGAAEANVTPLRRPRRDVRRG